MEKSSLINKKAQVFYIDFMIGLMLFTLVAAIFFYNYDSGLKSVNIIENEAIRLSEMLMDTGYPEHWNTENIEQIGILDNEINKTKLKYLKNIKYNRLKNITNMKFDFYIYLSKDNETEKINGIEDYDETTELVKIERIGILDKDLINIGVYVWK